MKMIGNSVAKMLKSTILVKNINNIRYFSVSSLKYDIVKIQSNDDFQKKVINSKVPVVVDFFATWCNPCKLLTPRIESVIAENKGKVLLAKVDIDEQTDLALDYKVSSVPVLVIIKDGKELQRVIGLQDTDKLKKWVDKFIEKEDQTA